MIYFQLNSVSKRFIFQVLCVCQCPFVGSIGTKCVGILTVKQILDALKHLLKHKVINIELEQNKTKCTNELEKPMYEQVVQ